MFIFWIGCNRGAEVGRKQSWLLGETFRYQTPVLPLVMLSRWKVSFFPLFLDLFLSIHLSALRYHTKKHRCLRLRLIHSCQENCYIIQLNSYLLQLSWLKVLKQWTVRLNSTFKKHLFFSSKQEEREAETNSSKTLCLGSAVVLDNILYWGFFSSS